MADEVYRNLRTGTWSLRRDGRVIDHPYGVVMKDAT